MTISLKEYRCARCKKLLFKGVLIETEIEIKCKGCHEMNTVAASKFDWLLCAIENCPNRIIISDITK